MSNTRLIYCSKETAEVSNDNEGSYTNSVDDGIVVKVGDEISIEQIAVNSVGVGAEIIEIPKTIKGYRYKTNAMTLNCAMYIHHNLHPYTIMLPLYGMNTINTTQTSPAYGYMEYGGTFPPTFPWANLKTKYSNDMRRNVSKRFYIGSYIFDVGQTPQNPVPNPLGVGNTPVAVPSLGVWEFMRTDLTFEVDTGYDNPANIANKITQDFHAGNATPQVFNNDNNGGALSAYSRSQLIGQPYDTEDLGVWTENTACYTLSNPPYAYISQVNYSLYQSNIAYQNPFYAYYGTRLLSNNTDVGGTGNKNNTWLNDNKTTLINANQPVNNAIYWLDTINTDIVGTGSSIDINTIITTNLPYDYFNASLLRDFIHSQKQFNTNAMTSTEGLNTNNTIRETCYSLVNWGRVSDASVDFLNRVALQSPIQAVGQSVFETIEIATFFDEDRWGKFNITDFGQLAGFKIAYDYITPYNNKSLNPHQLAKELDILIVPVLTGVFNGVPEINIGIVCNAQEKPAVRLLSCDYGLIDMSFMNVLNPSLLILGDKQTRTTTGGNVVGDYATTIQVGSPNINMLFDETRGRFAFENMCWNNMLQNPATGTTVNASAGQEAIQQGYEFSANYQYHTHQGPTYGEKYGLTGIGILDISVLDENYNQTTIDYYDDNDIKEKYGNSLLSRLGFNYKQLTNKNGRPDVIFTQRTYESKKPVRGVSLFPYPLTTNLRFDTSIDIGLSNNGTGGLPMFDIFTSLGFAVSTSAQSDRIYALNLPKKLENPFWLIQSDVIDGVEFNSEKSGGGNQNILAVCNRAYLAGDFAFSFSTNYAFKATKEFVISGIKTAILNPDLTPADIDEATTIIYKIVSPSPFFLAQEQAQLIAQKKKK